MKHATPLIGRALVLANAKHVSKLSHTRDVSYYFVKQVKKSINVVIDLDRTKLCVSALARYNVRKIRL